MSFLFPKDPFHFPRFTLKDFRYSVRIQEASHGNGTY